MLVYPLYFFVLFAFEISQPSATRLTMTLPFFAGFLLRPHRAVFYKSHFQEDLCACQNVDVSQNTRPLEAADADEAKLLCSISIMIDFIFSLRLYSFLFSFFCFSVRVLIAAVWELYEFAALNYPVNVDRLGPTDSDFCGL